MASIVSAIVISPVWTALGLYDTWVGVILAQALFSVRFALLTITAARVQIDPRVEQVSRS